MATLVTVTVKTGQGADPFGLNKYTTARKKIKAFRDLLKSLSAGGLASRSTTRPTLRYGTATATGTVTAASIVADDTVTINGKVFTAKQLNATATATFASLANNDTVTVQGVVFTAKTSPAANSYTEFALGASDTTAAAALVALFNVHPSVNTIIGATSAAGVVTFRAIAAGTAGNAYTLVSSNGTRAAVTGSGTLANGAAASGDQFDIGATNTQCAAALAAAINASTTAGVPGIVTATSATAVVTVAAAHKGLIGNAITLASSNGGRAAVSAARLAGGTDTVATL